MDAIAAPGAVKPLQRDCFFDNARFLLICSVVIGHLGETIYPMSYAVRCIFKFIYIFHMPCFLFISGYFSKTAIRDGKPRTDRLVSLLVLYIVCQIAFFVFDKYILGADTKFSFFDSRFGLWYVVFLIQTAVTLPAITRFRKTTAFCAFVVMALLIGLDPRVGHFANIRRYFVFMPFFLMGFYMDGATASRVFHKRYWIIAVLVFAVAAACVLFAPDLIIKGMLSGKNSYDALKLGASGIYQRLIWYIYAGLASWAFLVLTPKCRTFFSTLGQRTQQVFILHLMLTIAYSRLKLGQTWLESFPLWRYLIIPAGLLITLILSLKPFSAPFKLLDSFSKRLAKWIGVTG